MVVDFDKMGTVNTNLVAAEVNQLVGQEKLTFHRRNLHQGGVELKEEASEGRFNKRRNKAKWDFQRVWMRRLWWWTKAKIKQMTDYSNF